jgi:hypothetical protein
LPIARFRKAFGQIVYQVKEFTGIDGKAYLAEEAVLPFGNVNEELFNPEGSKAPANIIQ